MRKRPRKFSDKQVGELVSKLAAGATDRILEETLKNKMMMRDWIEEVKRLDKQIAQVSEATGWTRTELLMHQLVLSNQQLADEVVSLLDELVEDEDEPGEDEPRSPQSEGV